MRQLALIIQRRQQIYVCTANAKQKWNLFLTVSPSTFNLFRVHTKQCSRETPVVRLKSLLLCFRRAFSLFGKQARNSFLASISRSTYLPSRFYFFLATSSVIWTSLCLAIRTWTWNLQAFHSEFRLQIQFAWCGIALKQSTLWRGKRFHDFRGLKTLAVADNRMATQRAPIDFGLGELGLKLKRTAHGWDVRQSCWARGRKTEKLIFPAFCVLLSFRDLLVRKAGNVF